MKFIDHKIDEIEYMITEKWVWLFQSKKEYILIAFYVYNNHKNKCIYKTKILEGSREAILLRITWIIHRST